MKPNNRGDRQEQGINRRALLRSGAIAAGSLVAGVGAVSAEDEPQTFSIPLGGCQPAPPCIGEVLCLTEGVLQMKIHTFSDESGGIHWTRHSHFTPRAVADGQTTGTIWTGQGVINGSKQRHLKGPFPQTIQVNDNTALVSEGSTPNLYLHTNTHLTVNANGEVTVERDETTVSCEG